MRVGVIGAGTSGLICAYKLREGGHDVVLFDKNEKVGRKIYITGKGRCNLTNNCTWDEFFENVVTNSKFLFSAFSNWNSQDTMDLFESNGVPLVTERGNRVFPKSYKASDIVDTLYRLNRNSGVILKLGETVTKIYKNCEVFVLNTDKNTYEFDKVVIATGGKSYSHTGSTGDGYKFAQSFGHTIVNPVPGLCALRVREAVPARMYNFTQKNVTLKVKTPTSKIEEFGDITFYKEGIAGPIAITISSQINKVESKNVQIEIDFKPALSEEKLDQRIIRETQNPLNKTVEDLLHKLMPSDVLSWFVSVSKINTKLDVITLKKEERENIVKWLKSFKLTYLGLDDIDRAIITSGGVSTKEINPKTMESKIVSGLYFTGEVIDVDAYTGGFNMQIAFSTGALAAKSIG